MSQRDPNCPDVAFSDWSISVELLLREEPDEEEDEEDDVDGQEDDDDDADDGYSE